MSKTFKKERREKPNAPKSFRKFFEKKRRAVSSQLLKHQNFEDLEEDLDYLDFPELEKDMKWN